MREDLKNRRLEKGYILIASYFLITILEIFSMALFSRSHVFFQTTERNKNSIIAFNMAEAGIDRTIGELATDSNYAGTNGTYTSLGNQGGYDITVCPPSCDGVQIPADPLVRLVRANGYAPGNNPTLPAYEVRPVTAYLQLDTTPFDFAAYAEDSLILNGVPLVDSYNSDNGNYGGLNIGTNGDIASDGTISLIGNPTVNGDVVNNPSISCEPASTQIPSVGPLNINGNTDYQLAGGTYHFDSISVTGNGKITATGPVTIYVDGAVDLGGNGVATFSNLPSNFLVFATNNGSISISGNGGFYGGIFAPNSAVSNGGNATIYGGIISKTYQQNGTAEIHYDEAMSDVIAPCTGVEMLSWRESNTAAG